MATIPAPANAGAIYHPPVPMPGFANAGWAFDLSAAINTAVLTTIGFKTKI